MHLYFETTVLKILYVLVNINEALYAVLLTALKDDIQFSAANQI